MKKYYIYKLWNTKNSKLYFGQTRSPYFRFQRCQYRAKKIADAIAKIGWTNFHAEIVYETTDKAKADEMELHYIVKFDTVNNGYNSTYNTHYIGNKKRLASSKKMQREAMSKKTWYYNPKTGETFRFSPEAEIPSGFIPGRGNFHPTNPFGHNN